MAAMHDNTDQILRKQIKFRSWHRGCKETDVILGRFADAHLENMSGAELREFAAILDEDDADLFRWLTGELAVPARMNDNSVLSKLLKFDVSL